VTFTWREHDEAHYELRAAVLWYEERREGWGGKFADSVERAIESLLDPSTSWGFYRAQQRVPQVYSRRVAGFPFNVIYLRVDDVVYIVAYAHERRRPGYWEDRLET
jgi:hypothetical protein